MKGLTVALLGLTLLVSTIGASISAQESLEGKALSDEDEFESMPREVTVDPSDGEFEIRSFGPAGDRIRVRFTADVGELRLDFTPPGNETVEVELQLTLEALLEYVEEEGVGTADLRLLGVQEFPIDEMLFTPPAVQPFEEGYVITIRYTLPPTDLSLEFTFWVFENETRVGDSLVRPTEVKFDIDISFFPFETLESSLALIVELKTEVEPQVNFTGTQAELEAIGERYSTFFRWAKNATVDGGEARVTSKILSATTELEGLPEVELEVERTIFLSYPRGNRIVHDPVVGVAAVPPSPPPPPPPTDGDQEPVPRFSDLAYAVMLGVAALFVIATLLVRRRRYQ